MDSIFKDTLFKEKQLLTGILLNHHKEMMPHLKRGLEDMIDNIDQKIEDHNEWLKINLKNNIQVYTITCLYPDEAPKNWKAILQSNYSVQLLSTQVKGDGIKVACSKKMGDLLKLNLPYVYTIK